MAADVERFAAIGPRFGGNEGERRARELLGAELGAAGLVAVGEEGFEYLAYDHLASACEPAGCEALPCVGLQSCAAGVAEAEAVYVAAGEEADLRACEAAGGRLAGRIAVLRTPMPAAVSGALCERGVAGLILLSPTPDGLIGHFTATFYPPPVEPPWDGRVLPVPGVTVEAAAGERLLARLSAGPTAVRIEHRASYRQRTGANVVGEVTGSGAPRERIVVGAHYDTQLDSPGAADNGSGLAALLAIARAWSAAPTRRTVAFVAFAAEELACWGATAYVRRHASRPPLAMVNLDALGPPLLARRTIVADPAIAGLAAEASRATGWEVEREIDAREFPFADHAPFVDAGIPACWIWRYPPPHPYYHSAGDTPRWVDPRALAADARAAASTIFRLAEDEAVPSPRQPAG